MGCLGVLPAAEDFIDGEEVDFGECGGVPLGDGIEAGAEEMLGGDLLAFRGIEVFQIGLGDSAGAAFVDCFVHPGDRAARPGC